MTPRYSPREGREDAVRDPTPCRRLPAGRRRTCRGSTWPQACRDQSFIHREPGYHGNTTQRLWPLLPPRGPPRHELHAAPLPQPPRTSLPCVEKVVTSSPPTATSLAGILLFHSEMGITPVKGPACGPWALGAGFSGSLARVHPPWALHPHRRTREGDVLKQSTRHVSDCKRHRPPLQEQLKGSGNV